MKQFDVFNGDADGLCALHQLRLATPVESGLVTGVKRDIALLGRVPAGDGDAVTVLDISIDANRDALLTLLERGASVQYFDHHGSGRVPAHPRLHAHIDTAADICTGVIVDRHLGGQYRAWAVVAAFGDNMGATATKLADSIGLDPKRTAVLKETGESLNYNGYGDSEDDLIVHPAALYALLKPYRDPFDFVAAEAIVQRIRDARAADLEMARQTRAQVTLPHGSVFVMPDAAWSRRVRGLYGNMLANARPQRAHAVLTPDGKGGYTVSVRAPLARMHGAHRLCSRFPGGGGREAAAGINHLPAAELPGFILAFDQAFS